MRPDCIINFAGGKIEFAQFWKRSKVCQISGRESDVGEVQGHDVAIVIDGYIAALAYECGDCAIFGVGVWRSVREWRVVGRFVATSQHAASGDDSGNVDCVCLHNAAAARS